MKNKKTIFCFGIGYSALNICKSLIDQDWHVAGTVRENDKAEELISLGIEAIAFKNEECSKSTVNEIQKVIKNSSHLLISLPPKGDDIIPLVRSMLGVKDHEVLSDYFDWVGYLSSTSVYGDKQGAVVDENSICNPSGQRQQDRFDKEKQWLLQGAISFRLAGIYGPDRNYIKVIKNGKGQAINKPGHKFSRIHVEDIKGVVINSMLKSDNKQHNIYNVCDDLPCEQYKVMQYAGELIGVNDLPVIDFAGAELSKKALTFWKDNKQVDNSRMKNDLGYDLVFKDYKKGLQHEFLNISNIKKKY